MESAIPTRRRPGSTLLAPLRDRRLSWAAIGLAALCAGAIVGYFAFPTYPTYDSFYALLWGRDLLHAHLPDFRVYRGPTEHPLAIASGAWASDRSCELCRRCCCSAASSSRTSPRRAISTSPTSR